MNPGSLPEPPDDILSIDPLITSYQLSEDKLWHRIHPRGRRAEYYGVGNAPRHRFDDPRSKFGVLYVADEFKGSFIEVYSDVFVENDKLRLIELSSLEKRSYSTLKQLDSITVVNLCEDNFLRLGLDKRIFTTAKYKIPQLWSRAFFEFSSEIDGILYPSRVSSGLNLALYNRASQKITSLNNYGTLSENRNLTDPVADKHGVIIDDWFV